MTSMKLVTVSEMQTIEHEANAAGLTYEIMMENAGRNLAEVILDDYRFLEEQGALGLVGSGNNGGDTLVALAHLAGKDWKATALIVRPRPADDPLVQRLVDQGGVVHRLGKTSDLSRLDTLLKEHALLLDGVLGTGTRLPLKPDLAELLEYTRLALQRMDEPPAVLAVDCPSGVNCDTGQAALECIPAEMTVTMAAIKQGLLKFPAFNLAGEIRLVGIGLPQEGEGLVAWQAVKCIVPDDEWVRQVLPVRPLDAHKGTFGTALIVAGSVNYTGAALLAGQAAYRSGAGLVTLAVPAPLHAALAGIFPEATWLLLPHELGVVAAQAAEIVLQNLEHATSLLIGPGFGLEDTSAEFLARIIGKGQRSGGKIGFVRTGRNSSSPERADLPPLVVDADGLKLLTRLPEWAAQLPALSILTPHPGEMSVLTSLTRDEIQADRLGLARMFSQKWGHIVVLKGAFTVIAAPNGQAAVIPVATPALARAGTGDVLAGLIAGLRAQGVDSFEAAVAGAWIHAHAGLKAEQTLGNSASVLAGDVLSSIIDVITELS